MIQDIKKHWFRYIVLFVVFIITILPFIWMVATSFKSPEENIFAMPPKLVPEHFTFANYIKVFNSFPFIRYLLNSTIVALGVVFSNIITSSLAGYALARIRFKGRQIFLIAILSTLVIPFQTIMIPIFVMVSKLHLTNSYLGLILPYSATAFSIFMMRQAFIGLPDSLDDAARLDGANTFQIFYKVMFPLVKPMVAAVAIFSFVSAWGDFLWPLLILKDPQLYTLPLGVQSLAGGLFSNDWRLISAGAVFSILPITIVFIFAQKYFISGVTQGAIKG